VKGRSHPFGSRPGKGQWEQGISYVEILFALVVLSIGILGVAGALTTATLDIYGGGRETDDLLSYADPPPAGATSPRPAYVAQSRNAWLAALQNPNSGGSGPGQGSIAITQQGLVPNRLARVTVTVEWPGQTGGAPISFVTQVTEWP